MDAQNRMIGGRMETVVGATEFVIPTGYAAYGCTIQVDGTIIKEIKERTGSTAAVAKTNKTWMIAKNTGNYISFEFPVTAITLTGATDSVDLYLEPKTF
jgi:hypothetical protein